MEKVVITRRPVPPSDLPPEALEETKKRAAKGSKVEEITSTDKPRVESDVKVEPPKKDETEPEKPEEVDVKEDVKSPGEVKPEADDKTDEAVKPEAGKPAEPAKDEAKDQTDTVADDKAKPDEPAAAGTPPPKKGDDKKKSKTPKSEINEDGSNKKKSTTFFSRIGLGQERDFLVENLSVLIASGMNVMSALDAIHGEMKTKVMKKTIETLRAEVDEGMPIWKSLDNTGLFTKHAIALLKIGEESGRLPANLKVISEQSQKDRMFKSKLFSALMYPVAVLAIAFILGILIAWYLLPKMSGIFDSMHMKLPFLTRVIIAVGKFLGTDGYWAVPVLFTVVFTLGYFLFVNKKTLYIGQAIMFKTPIINRMILEIELARFGYILSNLLGAGIPLVDSLDSLSIASSYIRYQKFYAFMRDNIELGNTFQKCFSDYPVKSSKLIPYPIQMMVITSEQSGKLQETLGVIGHLYDEKTEITTKNLSTMLEPIMMIVIFGAVLVLALGVLLPLYGMLGGIK